MKKQAYTNLIIRSSFAFALVLSLTIWSPVLAQSAEPVDGKNMTEAKMMEQCQEMKEHREKMMTEMKAQDVELTAQVAKMNSAPKDNKLDLMAAVITRMVEQRTAMNERKEAMQEKMMHHMMQHMQMGKESMPMCPMMKGMKGMDSKSMDMNKEY
jgi:hypothetical protein